MFKRFWWWKISERGILKKGIKDFLQPYIVKSNSTVFARRYFITNKDIDQVNKDIDQVHIFDVNLSIVIKPAKLSLNDEAKVLCEDIDEIKRAYSGSEQNLQIIKAVESLLENNIKKIVHYYNFMKGGIPEGVL